MAVEIRFVVHGDTDVKKTLADIQRQGREIRHELALAARDGSRELNKQLRETTKEADRLEKYLKAADAEAKRGLTVTVGEARRLFKACGDDVKVFEFALRQAGVRTADIKILSQQITRELKESRREAMGLDGNMDRLKNSIKSGAFQAQAMTQAFEKAKEALQTMQRLGKVKGLEDSTKDAMLLQDKYDELQEKLGMVNDKEGFAKIRKNVRDVSLRRNISQDTLLDAVLKAEEAQSAGRLLTLGRETAPGSGKYNDEGGALLDQLAAAAYGNRSQNVPESIKTAVDMMMGLGITDPKLLKESQGIIRAGEQKGAISAEQIGNKGQMFIQSLAQAQGTTGIEALRRGAALFQTMGSAPGINGNFDEANVRLKDLLGKLLDPKTRDRMKDKFGVNFLDKEGKLREIPDILAEVAKTGAVPLTQKDMDESEIDPKKKAKYKDFFEVFREQESRQGFLGLLMAREKIRPLEQVQAREGNRLLEEGFNHRLWSGSGRLEAISRRDEATHLEKLHEKEGYIAASADAISRTQADHPYLSAAASFMGDIAGIAGPKAKMFVEGSIASAAMLTSMDKPDPATELRNKDHAKFMKDHEATMKQLRAETSRLQAEIQGLRHGQPVNINVKVESGMTATVTQEGRSSSGAARPAARTMKPGR